MRALIQRVQHASVTIDNEVRASIGEGILVLLGIEEADDMTDVEWLCGKITRLRIFRDEKGVMNLSVLDMKGDAMVVSQFTLHASTRKGTGLPTSGPQVRRWPSPCTNNSSSSWKKNWARK